MARARRAHRFATWDVRTDDELVYWQSNSEDRRCGNTVRSSNRPLDISKEHG